MDPRTTPSNGRVAASRLRGLVEAELYVDGVQRCIGRPVADLLRSPNGARDRQLLMGDTVTVFDEVEGYRFVQSAKDGYVGYVQADALATERTATHWVAVPGSHAYSEPDMKSNEAYGLSIGAQVTVASHVSKFFETDDGQFVPRPHLWPIEKRFSDPVTVAQMFFGTPYLWGGNSIAGIDCSGLVQAAFLACGRACPGDSDMQADALGRAIPKDGPPQRGDLYFWKGHVAMAVDGTTLIHANAHHMAVVYEPIEKAIQRIEAQGDGRVLARKRFD